jgi:hypothetical protein
MSLSSRARADRFRRRPVAPAFNSAGWDLAEDVLAAVAKLSGDDDPAMVNPDFPGYWKGYPPPG